MRMMTPLPPRWGFSGNERVGRVLAVRDGQGALRRIDAASTVAGPQEAPGHDAMMRDLALLIALKKKKH